MPEIDQLINFIFSNIDDESVSLKKRLKNGYRNYYLNVELEYQNNSSSNCSTAHDDFSIVIDNENGCLDIFSNFENLIIESKELCDKWSVIFEDYLSNNISKEFDKMIEKTFANSSQKNILREYKLQKINI